MGKAVEQMLPKKLVKNRLNPFLFIGDSSSEVFAVSATSVDRVESDLLADVDVWIDFTSATGLMALLKATNKFNTSVVSGSTGLSKTDFTKLKTYSKKRKLFWASNLSPGLWAFRQALKSFESISTFDFSLEEIHHIHKKDRPSGTAKTLHADLEKITNKKIEAPISLRLGGVFGIHTVVAASENEFISIQHQALNRRVFAEGALLAADWLVKQQTGLYSMENMFFKNK